MAHTFYFGNVKKRINSTLQGGTSAAFDVLFKNPTSLDVPVITLHHSGDFEYNYARYKDRYYFVTDVKSLNNDMWEVSLELDPLATAKGDILASTQFVSYSNISGGMWLQDNRVPVMKNAMTAVNSANLDFPTTQGSYILTVLGKTGVDCFRVTRSTIQSLIEGLQNWTGQTIDDIKDAFDFSDETHALESLSNAVLDSGFLGNAYEVATQCIRSCHWVPFSGTVIGGVNTAIYLGEYPAKDSGGNQLYGYKLDLSWTGGNVGISIPWHYTDWRRVYCEKVYLYLPFVGMVSLNSDDINGVNGLTIKYSITPSDGQVCYEVIAGNQIIGTYGGNCAMQIPIGINQKASLGDIVTTMFAGAEKAINTAVHSTISPLSASAATIGYTMNAVQAMYDTADVMMSTTPSTVGGIGGGAGAGLDLQAKCITVAHPTVIEPAQMAVTMGVPTMKPLQLSNCSGYCQCANAHVATDLDAQWIAKIDAFLNSGFYIE